MGSNAGNEIIVVDDRRLVAESIAAYLTGSGLEARAVPPVGGPVPGKGLALVSLGTASRGGQVATLNGTGWRVVVYGPWDERRVGEAVSDGAAAFISGESSLDELESAVRALLSGRGTFDAAERSRLIGLAQEARQAEADAFQGLASLTPRERDVLDSLLLGRRTTDIAADSYVSVTTVRNQVQSILTKLNVHSQLEAVATARRHGWGVRDAGHDRWSI